MKTKDIAALMLARVTTGSPLVSSADAPPTAGTNATSAGAILRQVPSKLGAAHKFGFRAQHEMLAAQITDDGLPPNAVFKVTMQRVS